jgi:putative DNA modification/repair radical SAM protein
MNVQEKLAVLAGAARYDASCASGGAPRSQRRGRVGSCAPSGICHSWSADGRCISLLKILFSNACAYDCAYCVNRRTNDVPRATFEVDELVRLVLAFYRRNYVEGLFLSSGVCKTPDHTMERMVAVLRQLRVDHSFAGYIHVKALPGAGATLVDEAGRFADRVSVNIELPSAGSLVKLAPQKDRDAILRPMGQIRERIDESRGARRRTRSAPRFAPAGQSTQLIVGASPEDDRHILQLAEGLYRRYDLRRVYYSAYVPVSEDARIARVTAPPLVREHRLYQADWLVRLYGFAAGEILDPAAPWLEPELDPKTAWALRNIGRFPVDVNVAAYEWLLRVPGIGRRSASRIVGARRFGPLDVEDLRRIGVVWKRARFFASCRDATVPAGALEPDAIRRRVATARRGGSRLCQGRLFPAAPAGETPGEEAPACSTGTTAVSTAF